MAIELSYERFNNGDDIVPWYSTEEVILNTGDAKTLAGDDRITGVGPGRRPSIYDSGIINRGTIEMGLGDDMITGTYDDTEYSLHNANYARLRPNNGRSIYKDNRGRTLYYPDDSIPLPVNNYGIYNSGTIDTGLGDDTITGINSSNMYKPNYISFYDWDTIAIYNPDEIGINNGGTIDTKDGDDSIISQGKFINYGDVFLGEGNDTITSYGVIYNDGKIDTSSGNDSIIAYGGFESGLNNSGRVLLGPGEDSVYGFGSGDFYGGDGVEVDTLELTFGSYIVRRVGAAVSFTKGSSVMNTSEFEILRVNSTDYYFDDLIDGQTIGW